MKQIVKRNWSSFWLADDFEKPEYSGIDYTKLAATQRAIGNFVNIVTGKQIPVVFQSNDSSYTDGERVVIGTKLDNANFDPAVGLALHEGSHIAYTDFTLFKDHYGNSTGTLSCTVLAKHVNNIKHKKLGTCTYDQIQQSFITESEFGTIKNILNWVEDRRIDYLVYTNAPGYRVYYQSMYDKYFNDAIIDTALKNNAKTQETWDDYLFHIINFTNPHRNLTALKKLKDIWSVIDLKNINRLSSTLDALAVSYDIFELIKLAISEENILNPTPNSKGDAESGDAESEDAPDGDDIGDGGNSTETDQADDIKSNKLNPVLSDKQLARLEKSIESQKKFLSGNPSKTGKLSKSQSAIITAIKESGTEIRRIFTDESKSNAIDTIVIKKLTPAIIASLNELFEYRSHELINNQVMSESDMRRFNDNQTAVQLGITLGRVLGNKLQLRNADRTLKHTRLQTGKIDRRLVAQLGYDNVNVFHQIVTDRYKNYFIHISIDASGSMSGAKFHNSITSAVAIAQAASMTTGIRVQISLRGTATLNSAIEKCVTIYAYDSAHDKMSKITQYFKYLSTYGCTPEGLSFKSIEKDIKSDAKGDELIFINYSDGYPSTLPNCQYGYNGVSYTRKIINDFKSIGIQIISYFITNDKYTSNNDRDLFYRMYGLDSKFIDPVNMLEVSRTMNAKFLETVQ